MEQLITYIDTYGLLVVIAGILSSILCGCIKVPIVRAIRAKNLGEKATSNRITSVCTFIIAVFSSVIVIVYTCIKAHSFSPFMGVSLYSDILLAITFAKIAYMLYEGVGSVSLKKLAHQIFAKIKDKAKNKKISSIQDYVELVQSVMVDTLHMPLTDAQKEILRTHLENGSVKEETRDGEEV